MPAHTENPFWTPHGFATATRGRWHTPAPAGPITGVSIDSRSIAPGQAFVALRGERFDGHDFIESVARAGAPIIIAQHAAHVPAGTGLLIVPDTQRALADLASAYRDTLRCPVVAVCGSNGKTTTTRLIDAALSSRRRGTCPQKSFNNNIGVPLTILRARADDEYLIVEVGSNAPGEIAALGRIVRPDGCVIVSIGREHLAGFGDLAGVAAEESAIIDALAPGGWCVATGDAPELTGHLTRAKDLTTFGRTPGVDVALERCEHRGVGAAGELGLVFVTGGQEFVLPLIGEHNACNALGAIAAARRLGLGDADIARGLAGTRGPEMRLQRTLVHGITLINDAYNANPESMLASLRAFAQIAGGAPRRVAVLGDMLELGGVSDEAHREIGLAAGAMGTLDVLACVGESMRHAGEAYARARPGAPLLRHLRADESALEAIASALRPGDWVLLKGSRGMRLERLLDAIRARHPAPVGA